MTWCNLTYASSATWLLGGGDSLFLDVRIKMAAILFKKIRRRSWPSVLSFRPLILLNSTLNKRVFYDGDLNFKYWSLIEWGTLSLFNGVTDWNRAWCQRTRTARFTGGRHCKGCTLDDAWNRDWIRFLTSYDISQQNEGSRQLLHGTSYMHVYSCAWRFLPGKQYLPTHSWVSFPSLHPSLRPSFLHMCIAK